MTADTSKDPRRQPGAETHRPTETIIDRRHFIAAGVTFIGLAAASSATSEQGQEAMYGLIAKIDANPGQRDALAAILLEGVSGAPGCLSYIVAEDGEDPDALWVTEVWDSQSSHAASLSLPSVQAAIQAGRPLIAGFSQRTETRPVGGVGL